MGGDSALQGIFTRAREPREERGEQPRAGHALQGGRGAVRAEHFEKLLADAFAGGSGDAIGIAADGGEGTRFDTETEAGLQPKGPDEPHRVVPERGGGHHADGFGGKILPTAGDVDDRARGDIERHGVDGEIPVAQVLRNGSSGGGGDVDDAARGDHPPQAECRFADFDDAAPGGGRKRLRVRPGVSQDGHVVIGRRAPEQQVADAAADEVGPLAGRKIGGKGRSHVIT